MFAQSCVNATGTGQAEVELSRDSLVRGPPLPSSACLSLQIVLMVTFEVTQ